MPAAACSGPLPSQAPESEPTTPVAYQPCTPQAPSSLAQLAWVVALVALCGALFFHHLAERDLWSSHEGRAAQDAAVILGNGGWGVPRLFDGHAELQKPPLYYWLVAWLARLRGTAVDAWVVRLPAALAGLAAVLGICLWGRGRDRAVAGLVAALVLATCLHFTWLARTARIDMPLALAVGTALGAFYLAQRRRREAGGRGAWCWLLPAYAAVGVAVLLKGPIGAVLPLSVAGVYLVVEREIRLSPRSWLRLAHDFGLWWGIPLVLALTLPCYLWINTATRGEFFRSFIWYHNIGRAFGGSGGLQSHPWWLYVARLAVDLLPWSLLLPAAVWFLWQSGGLARDPEARFGLVWLVTMTVVLSCARFKRADYLVPAYPGAALLLGCAGERWYRRAGWPRWMPVALVLLVAGCAGGWWYYVDHVLPAKEAGLEDRRFAAAIRRLAPVPRPVLFFRAEAHALAFHVGRPLGSLLEWENLDWWAARPESTYVIMPPQLAGEWPRHLKAGRLEVVLRNTDLAGGRHAHPLVLLRTHPGAGLPGP